MLQAMRQYMRPLGSDGQWIKNFAGVRGHIASNVHCHYHQVFHARHVTNLFEQSDLTEERRHWV